MIRIPLFRLVEKSWSRSVSGTSSIFPEINPVIVEHNRMAAKVMAEARVSVNDFYGLLSERRQLAKGDRFHWTAPAYKLLGEKATASILEAMSDE